MNTKIKTLYPTINNITDEQIPIPIETIWLKHHIYQLS